MSLLTLIHINMSTSCVLTQVIFWKACWWDITGITSVLPRRHNLLAYSLLLWIFSSFPSPPYIEELSDKAPQNSYRSLKKKKVKTNTDIRSPLLSYLSGLSKDLWYYRLLLLPMVVFEVKSCLPIAEDYIHFTQSTQKLQRRIFPGNLFPEDKLSW